MANHAAQTGAVAGRTVASWLGDATKRLGLAIVIMLATSVEPLWATITTVTIKGSVAAQFTSTDYAGVFVPLNGNNCAYSCFTYGNLEGLPFTAVFTIDSTKGMQTDLYALNGTLDSSEIEDVLGQDSPITATLTINGTTVAYGCTISQAYVNLAAAYVSIIAGGSIVEYFKECSFTAGGLSFYVTSANPITIDAHWQTPQSLFITPTDTVTAGFTYELPGSSAIAASGALVPTTITIAGPPPPPADDTVSLSGQGSQTALWINGLLNATQLDHQPIAPTSANPVDLTENVTVSTAAYGNEIVGFTTGAPPTLLTAVPWTDGSDARPLSFRPLPTVGIQVWNMGANSITRLKAEGDVIEAGLIALSERIGFHVNAKSITDVPSTTAVSPPTLFVCSGANVAQIQRQFPPVAGAINVYYFPRVQGLKVDAYGNTGYDDVHACTDIVNTNFIAVSAGAPPDSLIHEIGHAMSLTHPCQTDAAGNCTAILPGFDEYNVMTQHYGPERLYFSEGQIFRMSFGGQSALTKVYAVPGSGVRTCAPLEADLECPALDRRLWPDGNLPAN